MSSPWRNRLARSAVTQNLETERLVVQAHPGTNIILIFYFFVTKAAIRHRHYLQSSFNIVQTITYAVFNCCFISFVG